MFAHGFVYRKNESSGVVEKMSKTIGNVVEPMELIEKFSAEGFRYYFMSQCPFGGDGEFSFERFADTYNAHLANNLGNLYSRVLAMVQKYFEGNLEGSSADRRDGVVAGGGGPADGGGRGARSWWRSSSTRRRLQKIWLEVLDAANRYVAATEPFRLIKTDREGTKVALVNLAHAVRTVAILIKPFLPETAATFYRAFNFEEGKAWDEVTYDDAAVVPGGARAADHGASGGGEAEDLVSEDRGGEGVRRAVG